MQQWHEVPKQVLLTKIQNNKTEFTNAFLGKNLYELTDLEGGPEVTVADAVLRIWTEQNGLSC